MKKRLFVFNLFICCFSIYSQSSNYFKFTDYNHVFDYRNEINYERIESYENLKNKLNINKVITTVNSDREKKVYENYYENGLLTKYVSYVHGLHEVELKYDGKIRLEKYGEDSEYKYISDFCREVFYQNHIKFREDVAENETLLKITRNKFSLLYKSGETISDGKIEEDFIYDSNNNLIQYVGSSWNQKGIKSNFTKNLKLFYDKNGKLERIVSGYNENDIRKITEVSYDENWLMTKIIAKDGNCDYMYDVTFSDYDNYGNWHKSIIYYMDGDSEIVIRDISYVE